ncbi:hypothetical protein ONZ43_g850 [Nemania bipapillata]|uniref:Uncharacterized protein n=1 Tax=Nemania bipapillata TaxID=110536 RepID=A0ACC2J6Z9_9PEZI|nr:hypothetical protein ONZ43_g850 [Nemania bipapillata]
MRFSSSLGCGLVLLRALAASAGIPSYFQRFPVTRSEINAATVLRELGQRVSSKATLYGPSDSRYPNATARWNNFAIPQIQIVVVAGEESDVSTIVRYCNENSLEFLAINGGHGNGKSLGSFKGVQINLKNLRNISIQDDGKTAWFGGGVYDGEANSYLWDQGYVVTTGSCDCVGMMGAGLGGGHGRLEGPYGMISDNIVQLHVVLGNGQAVVVNETSHSDLLWAMKGAGHNFGIVTSFEMRIYPNDLETWHYHSYIWTGDKLEAIFTALNNLQGNGTTPVNMTTNYGNFAMNTSITDTEPVICWTFAYRGSAKEAEGYLTELNAIEAVYEEYGDIPYPEIASAQQTGVDDFICQDGYTRITATAGLQVYNLTTERNIFDRFTQIIARNPTLAAGGVILHEGYSTEGVTAVASDSSAYPFRDDHHLMLVQIIVPPGNATIEKAAWDWAVEVRAQWNDGQPNRPIDAYVNYANGFEPLQQMYGHEAWRLEKLRNLKAKYDPSNRFRYYNPIISS